MFTEVVIITILAAIVLVSSVGVTRFLLKKRLKGLEGHERIIHLFTSIIILAVAIYLFIIWGVFSLLIGSVTAAGSIALIVGFSLVPWIADAFVGLSLYLDPYIKVGVEIEIDGKVGRIIEMNLTRTKISGNECLYIVPNRQFREKIITIRSALPVAQLTAKS